MNYRIPTATHDPGEYTQIALDFYEFCAIKRVPNKAYSLADFVRPQAPNGYAYECTVAGLSGTREPRWPTTIGNTVVDGSVTWTCRAASTNGLNAITGPTASSDPTGLLVGNVVVNDATEIQATYSGGTDGQDYDVVYSFTLNGVARIARQIVQVRKR